MSSQAEEEELHLTTLDELEATQEQIRSYQGLLKELPEIFERKFNERLKAHLDRSQELTDQREQLLLQLQLHQPSQILEALGQPRAFLGAEASDSPPPFPPERPADSPRSRSFGRIGLYAGLAALGLVVGVHLSRVVFSGWQRQAGPLPVPAAAPGPAVDAGQSAASALRLRAVSSAMAEWEYFGRPVVDGGKLVKSGYNEGDPGHWERVLTYWQEGVGNPGVTSRDQVVSGNRPWSAAFLSYVMRKAGAGEAFPFSGSHAGLIKEAIAGAGDEERMFTFVGHRISAYAPRVGDLICAPRLWAIDRVRYENVQEFEFFPSRCEIVIGIEDGIISSVGGDLMNTVSLRKTKAVAGKLPPAENWLVVIELL